MDDSTYIIFAILFYSSQFILDNSIGYPIHFKASIYWMRRTIDTGIINKILNSLQRCICLIYFHPYFFWGKKKVPKAQNVDFCLEPKVTPVTSFHPSGSLTPRCRNFGTSLRDGQQIQDLTAFAWTIEGLMRYCYCWWLKSGVHQLRLVVYPNIFNWALLNPQPVAHLLVI